MKTIEYLEDSKGLYGIIFRDKYAPDRIVSIRPDKLSYGRMIDTDILYHCIPKKWKKACFESAMVRILTKTRLKEAGLGKCDHYIKNSIPKEKLKQYYAISSGSARAFNGMWKKLINESSNRDALKTTYKFPFKYRKGIYNAAATSERSLQLANTFPFLASVIYNPNHFKHIYNPNHFKHTDNRSELTEMVQAGEKLKNISNKANIPFVLRMIAPLATSQINENIIEIADQRPELFYNHLPKSPIHQIRWLHGLRYAVYYDPDFLGWIAKNINVTIKYQEFLNTIISISDWARNEHNFKINCSLQTAIERSELWHRELEFKKYEKLNAPFPEPWIAQEILNGVEFIPLLSGQELFEEGKAMHHCVGTYASFVTNGKSYIYSVRKNGKRVATLELKRAQDPYTRDTKYEIGQIRAECNENPDKSIKNISLKWITKHNNEQEAVIAAE